MKESATPVSLTRNEGFRYLNGLIVLSLFCFSISPASAKELVFNSTQKQKAIKIIIYGASGRVGSRIVHEALSRGHRVLGVGRTPSKITQRHKYLMIARGNVLDTRSVVKLLSGYDVVISAVGGNNPDSNDPMLSVPRQATVSLVSALSTLGNKAPRMIVIGGARTTLDSKPGVPYFKTSDIGRVQQIDGMTLTASMIGHKLALDYLRISKNIKWTFVSPPMRLRPGIRTGKFRVGNGVVLRDEQGLSAISMEDLAVAIINEIENPKYLNRRMTAAY